VRLLPRSPAAFCGVMVVFFAALLGLDHFANRGDQVLLGLVTWVVLLAACKPLPGERRAQVALVIAAATCTEVLGSLIWGVYEYRLGNLPPCVPPAHGLVYLTGLRLSETRLVARRSGAFVGIVLVAALGWTAAGLTVLPRLDVAGTIGALTFAAFVLFGRAPAIYCGVFVAVAALELYGTAIGTWRWAEEIPGLGLPDGNPPSGVASGYVLFDVIALTLAGTLLGLVHRAGIARGRRYTLVAGRRSSVVRAADS
jgi:hypothetical protein